MESKKFEGVDLRRLFDQLRDDGPRDTLGLLAPADRLLQGRALRELRVVKGKLQTDKGAMTVTCRHRKVGGACGGCYARLWLFLQMVKEVPQAAHLMAEDVEASLAVEDAAKRLGEGQGKRLKPPAWWGK